MAPYSTAYSRKDVPATPCAHHFVCSRAKSAASAMAPMRSTAAGARTERASVSTAEPNTTTRTSFRSPGFVSRRPQRYRSCSRLRDLDDGVQKFGTLRDAHRRFLLGCLDTSTSKRSALDYHMLPYREILARNYFRVHRDYHDEANLPTVHASHVVRMHDEGFPNIVIR